MHVNLCQYALHLQANLRIVLLHARVTSRGVSRWTVTQEHSVMVRFRSSRISDRQLATRVGMVSGPVAGQTEYVSRHHLRVEYTTRKQQQNRPHARLCIWCMNSLEYATQAMKLPAAIVCQAADGLSLTAIVLPICATVAI